MGFSEHKRARSPAMRLAQFLPPLAVIALAIAASSDVGAAAEASAVGPSSGLPVPRFVSLKSDRVNVRAGPTKEHEVTWIYQRAGLPVEVTAEFENWRRIRDWEGSEGWVYHSLLSGRRTALIAKPKDGAEPLPIYASAQGGPMVAKLEPGVLASVKRCVSGWCRLNGQGFDGWIEQNRLWGVYQNEKVD